MEYLMLMILDDDDDDEYYSFRKSCAFSRLIKLCGIFCNIKTIKVLTDSKLKILKLSDLHIFCC